MMDLDINLPDVDDFHSALPPAEPFPDRKARAGASRSQSFLKSSSTIPEEEGSESAEAQARKWRGRKEILIDEAPELRNSDLTQWSTNYVANMAEAARQKLQHKLPHQARKNAAAWVFGSGINGVGIGTTNINIRNPLDMFAGDTLIEALTGVTTRHTRQKRPRTDDEDHASEGSERRTRLRTAEEEIGRGESLILGDDSMAPIFGDDVRCNISLWPFELTTVVYRNRPGRSSPSRGLFLTNAMEYQRFATRFTSSVSGSRPRFC